MNGVSWIKSHVLRRDEKGMFGIPMGRILLIAIIGGCTYSFGKLIFGDLAGAVIAITISILTLIYTIQIGGIPRYKRVVFGWRGRLMGMAVEHPEGLAAQICEMFQFPVDETMLLDGNKLFKGKSKSIERTDDLIGWEIVTAPDQISNGGRGMIFVEKPLTKLILPGMAKTAQLSAPTSKVALPAKAGVER